MKKILLTIAVLFTFISVKAQIIPANKPIYWNNVDYNYTVLQVFDGYFGICYNDRADIPTIYVFAVDTLLYDDCILNKYKYYMYCIGVYSYTNIRGEIRTIPAYIFVPTDDYTPGDAQRKAEAMIKVLKDVNSKYNR